MRVYTITALTLGATGLIELLIGVYGHTEGSVEFSRFEPLRLTQQTVSFTVWIGGLSVVFGAAKLILPPASAGSRTN